MTLVGRARADQGESPSPANDSAGQKTAAARQDERRPTDERTAADGSGQRPKLPELISQLGAEAYETRRAAEQALAAMGDAARPALEQGLKATDLHTRRACRRLLDQVQEAGFRQRLDKFLAADAKGGVADLPGWERYCQVAGDSRPARDLFTKMLRAEPGLLESCQAEGDARGAALRLRARQIWAVASSGDAKVRRTPDTGSLAAVVFLASDPAVRPVPQELTYVLQYFHQQPTMELLKNKDGGEPLRKLFAQMLLTIDDVNAVRQCLHVAMLCDLKEPCLRKCVRMLQAAGQTEANLLSAAIGVVGVFGGREYASLIVPLLADERTCANHFINNKQIAIQVRDVAAAWLIRTTGQDLKQYGLERLVPWFDSVKNYPASGLHPGQIHFTEAAAREACLKKLREWLEKNPLPTAPAEAAAAAKPPDAKPPAAAPAAKPATASRPAEDRTRLTLAMADDATVKRLRMARQLFEEKRFEEAVVLLGEVLEQEDCVFRPDRQSDLLRSVRAEAESLLATAPAAALAAYDVRFGPAARHGVNEALAQRDLRKLAEMERQYAFTAAGRQAAQTLAVAYRGLNRPTMASVYLQRLLRQPDLQAELRATLRFELAACDRLLGRPDAVRENLRTWKGEWKRPTVTVGGREVPVFGEREDPYLWLQRALDAKGSGVVSGQSPDQVVESLPGNDSRPPPGEDGSGQRPKLQEGGAPWLAARVSLAASDHDYVNGLLTELEKQQLQRRMGAVPTVQPLAVRDLLIRRLPTGVAAVERDSGRLRWHVPAENALVHLLQFGDEEKRKMAAETARDGLRRRLLHDASWGTLTSNGRCVFVLEDLGFALGAGYQRVVTGMDGRRQLDTAPYERANVLAAYDVRTGKLKWQLGEAFGRLADGSAAGRFLAPPLPLEDLLYAVVDFGDETRLLTLEADTGSVLRQWVLDSREGPPAEFQLHGQLPQEPTPSNVAPPVLADGVIVCGTTSRRFAGVDVVSGATLWTYLLEDKPPAEGVRPRMMFMMPGVQVEPRTDRWQATTAFAAEGKALLMVAGSDELHCVDLRSGKPLWTVPRRDGLFIGGVWGDRVLVTARSSLRAVRLSDGQDVTDFSKNEFPAGGVPVGRGYLSGTTYYLPLTGGEVAAYDALTGRLVGNVLPSQPVELGNLTPVGGLVFSASLRSVQQFGLLAAVREATRKDPPAPTDRARLALATGDVEAAFTALTQAAATARNAEHERLLARSLILGLQQAAGPWADRVNPREQFRTEDAAATSDWLTAAELLTAVGRRSKALDIFEQLLAAPQRLEQTAPAAAARVVRLDCRVAAGLDQLRAAAGTAGDAELDNRLAARLAKAGSLVELNRHGTQRETEATCLRLAERIATDEKRRLEAELLLRRLLAHRESTQQAAAGARLPRLVASAGRKLEAEYLQTVHAASAQSAVPAPGLWSGAKIQVDKKKAPQPNQQDQFLNNQQYPVLLDSPDGPAACSLSLTYEVGSRKLVGVDRWGVRRFQIVLPEMKQEGQRFFNPGAMFFHGVSVGHLLFVHRGDMVVALDGLAAEPKQLWTQDTPQDSRMQFPAWPQMQMFFFNPMLRARQGMVGMLPRFVAATADFVCFQQGERLIAAEPLTGRLLWSRDDLSAQCDLVTDGRRLFATAPSGSSTLVLRATDGHLLERKTALPISERLALLGGRILRWEQNTEPPRVGLFDRGQQEYVWQQTVGKDTLVVPETQGGLGFVEPNGRVQLFDSATGQRRFAVELGALTGLQDTLLLRSGGVYVLGITLKDEKKQALPVTHQVFPGTRLVDGKLFGLDATTGAVKWTQPIVEQQFRLDQPLAVPVLVACNRQQKLVQIAPNSYRHDPPQLLLKCLDTRDGRILHESAAANRWQASYLFSTDVDKRRATLENIDEIVTFDFSE